MFHHNTIGEKVKQEKKKRKENLWREIKRWHDTAEQVVHSSDGHGQLINISVDRQQLVERPAINMAASPVHYIH